VRIDRRELAGAVADVGVLVPIAAALIVVNGLSPTAVLLPAGLLYLTAAIVYRLPVPVQPLKAFGAIAIAKGLGTDEIASGALLMGALFLTAGQLGVVDRLALAFPRALIRGVQLTVGLLFLKIAWGLLTDPPRAFAAHALAPGWAVPLAFAAAAVALLFKRAGATLALVGLGAVLAIAGSGEVAFGPSAIDVPSFSLATLSVAFTALVIPQAPLSFANSCLATSDAARAYFGERAAARVRPGHLATTLGSANLFAGAIGGMPVCHGAGGMTAHYSFGARTAAAPAVMGTTLLVLAVALGSGLGELLGAFPLPILAALLGTAGVLHIGLLRDLEGGKAWVLALLVGALGFWWNLAPALGIGLLLWWLPVGARRLRAGFA
jgi:SulP family sulfate permease